MEQYNVTGMSCAACQARVEKAVSKVPGVESCAVSLLTNSMGVEGTATPDVIIKAVEAAGYGASVKGAKSSSPSKQEQEDVLEDKTTPVLKKRLTASVIFLIVLMYFSMMPGSKGLSPQELAHRWVGLWECAVRNNPLTLYNMLYRRIFQ